MDVLDLMAKLSLDSSDYDKGLDKAKNMASSIGDAIGKGFVTMGKTAVAAIGTATTAVTAFAGASVKTGMDFDKSMSQVAATMGLSMDEMAEKVGSTTLTLNGEIVEFNGNLREFAQVMGENTAFSATQAADALNYMALAGYDVQTSMNMLPNVLNLAAAGGMELATASDMITDTQTAFGISLERTSQMVDEMAKAASTGNTNVQQLGEAFLTVGGLAQELNGGMVTLKDGTVASIDGVQELEIALTAMANAGIKGSEAGTHMRNMLLKLSSPTSDGTKALEEMGVTVFDTEGNMRSLADVFGDLSDELDNMTQEQKIQTISDLFNTRDLASAEALLGAVGQDWDKIGESILNSSYNFTEVNTALQESGVEWSKYADTAWGSAEDGITNLTQQIKYNLADQKLSVEETADFIASEYDMSMEDALLATQAVNDSLADLQGSAQKMADTQLDNLAGDITLFKSALEGAQIVVSDGIAPAFRDFVQLGTKGLSDITSAFKSGGMSSAMEAFSETLTKGLNMVISKLPDAINAGMQLLGALGQGIIDNLPTIVDAGVQIVVMLAQGLVEALPQLVTGFITLIEALKTSLSANAEPLLEAGKTLLDYIWNGISTNLPTFIENAYAAIPNLISQITDFIKNNGTDLIGAGLDLMLNLVEGIMESFPDVISACVDLFTQMLFTFTDPTNLTKLVVIAGDIIMTLANGILEAIPKLLDAVPQIISNLVGAIVSALPEILAVGIQLIIALATGLIEAIPRLVLAIPSLITAIVGGLVQGIQAIVNVGHDMVEGLWEGIKARWDGLVEDFKGLAEGLIDGVKGLFGIHSPSKVFAEMGRYIDEGFAQGINDYSGLVDDAVNDITKIPDVNSDINLSANGKSQGLGAGSSNSIIINVYGAEGQDEETIANIVADTLRDQIVSLGAT